MKVKPIFFFLPPSQSDITFFFALGLFTPTMDHHACV